MSYESLTDKLLKGKDDKFFVSVVPVSIDGAVLIGRRAEDGIWTTPGGGADPSESPEQAARRELFEEAGLVCGSSALELVNISETPRGFKIFSYLWRMPRGMAEFATSKLDPDQEVKKWKLYRPEDFPAAMQSEQNAPRLKTIREALMKYYGVTKSQKDPNDMTRMELKEYWEAEGAKHFNEVAQANYKAIFKKANMAESSVLSLIDKLNKGGPGSGIEGHKTFHPEEQKKHQALVDLGFEAQDGGSDFDEKKYAHLPDELKSHVEKIKEAADKFHETDEDSPGYAAAEKKLGEVTLAYQQAAKKMIEGQSKETPSAAHAPVNSDPAKPANKLQAHLAALEGGGVIPGIKTQSDKPVVTNMDQAKALGYDVQDHVDAMNAHYELAQKTQAMLEKLKMAGHKVPEEGKKIAQFHQKKMKEHMNAREYLEKRKTHTAAAIKQKKKDAIVSVKKSTSQMGGGLGDRDLDIGSFAQANAQADAEWMEKLYSGMEGFQYADEPRSFACDTGTMHLTKVDDGLYSGVYTKIDADGLEDHARVRIERMTIPELVEFMLAQEWIKNHKIEEAAAQSVAPPQMPVEPSPSEIMALNSTLMGPGPIPATSIPIDQKLKMLELISKLLS